MAQLALLTKVQVITSLSNKFDAVYVALLVPTLLPFFFH
jgi:hypothetical protein